MVQWIKNPVLSLQWLELLPWHKFDPWPRNFCRLRMPAKKKKKKKKDSLGHMFNAAMNYKMSNLQLERLEESRENICAAGSKDKL